MIKKSLAIGIVCPYAYDVPGGVQFHVRDVAISLRQQGHRVGVIVPAEDPANLPEGFTWAGSSIPFRYNGSTARLAVGPAVSRRVDAWLTEGNFDVIHVHEPFAPSVGMMALRQAKVPVVATFHSAQDRSRALELVEPLIRSSVERIAARIAVSQDARRTVVEHYGSDTVVIPNGVFVDPYVQAAPQAHWQGTAQAPTIAFLGRINEPRKGFDVLLDAIPHIVANYPNARFLVAGKGDFEGAVANVGRYRSNIEYLGSITELEKAQLFSSVDLYVAPQKGGESFGIVLVEAMSAGTTVLASDLHAFAAVLDQGRAGYLFKTGDAKDLALVACEVLRDPASAAQVRAHASRWVRRFDWAAITARIVDVYQVVTRRNPEERGKWRTKLRKVKR